MDYIYARVSTEDQDTENQVAELRAKYKFAQVIEETKSTRKVRPKLRDLLDIAEAGDRLIVWKMDRLSRSMIELQTMCAELDRRGIILISFTEAIDISTPLGKMFVAVLGMVAEMERTNISERTKLGIKNKKAIALAEGRVYRKHKSTKGKKGLRPPDHRPERMLHRLVELRELGLPWGRIAEKLAYENPEWKINASTAARIHMRIELGTQNSA